MLKMAIRLLILAFCSGLTNASAADRLRIATEDACPPFSFINEQGQLVGFNVDIARELCRHLEKDCQIIAVPWNELLSGLMVGRHQMVVASMAKTPQRERQAEFTDFYYRTRNVFIGRRDAGMAQVNPETAHGKILTVQAGTTYADYLRKHYPMAVLNLTATAADAFTALSRGEADLTLTDNLSAFAFLRSSAGQELDIIGAPLTIDETGEAAHIQVRKGDIPLRDAVNAALRKLWLDGAYHRINTRYFPFSIY